VSALCVFSVLCGECEQMICASVSS